MFTHARPKLEFRNKQKQKHCPRQMLPNFIFHRFNVPSTIRQKLINLIELNSVRTCVNRAISSIKKSKTYSSHETFEHPVEQFFKYAHLIWKRAQC